ncbi:ribosome assembly protein METTL17, mitochondrial [Lampetra fluviatilis]
MRLLAGCSWRRPQPRQLVRCIAEATVEEAAAKQFQSFRKHPGIGHVQSVKIPEPLRQGVKVVLAKFQIPHLPERIKELCNYLWSRTLPIEMQPLQRRASQVHRDVVKGYGFEETGDRLEKQKQDEMVESLVLQKLRKVTYHWKMLRYDEAMSLTFMAARMGGCHAATVRALIEIKKRVPDFRPTSLLDFGSGTGSSVWAAHETWSGSIGDHYCVDVSPAMNKLADVLLRGGQENATSVIERVYFRQFLPPSKVRYDVVVAAFSLSELGSATDRLSTVLSLWQRTNSFLVLIENGTLSGYTILMQARDALLQETDEQNKENQGHVFAPCPHGLQCPRTLARKLIPCNFTQNYQPFDFESKLHPSRTEKFSYLIFRRGEENAEQVWPRILQPVQCRTRHAHCLMCCSNGAIEHVVFTRQRHGRDLYRSIRHCKVGDRVPTDQLDFKENSNHESSDESSDESQ